jgi:hypothetical protein
MALTATADKITKEDILVQLNIKDAKTYISSFPVFRAPLPQILNYPKNQAVVCRKVGKVSDPC